MSERAREAISGLHVYTRSEIDKLDYHDGIGLLTYDHVLDAIAAYGREERERVAQQVWEECTDAICPTCREFGWPINDEHGNVFHTHDSWEGTRPCLATALNDIPSRRALAQRETQAIKSSVQTHSDDDFSAWWSLYPTEC